MRFAQLFMRFAQLFMRFAQLSTGSRRPRKISLLINIWRPR
jgi:hypothetical protein